jgi:hypothetical protein
MSVPLQPGFTVEVMCPKVAESVRRSNGPNEASPMALNGP